MRTRGMLMLENSFIRSINDVIENAYMLSGILLFLKLFISYNRNKNIVFNVFNSLCHCDTTKVKGQQPFKVLC